ncbi:MAG: Quinoprotein glucose dehydrogenase [Microgenomates group bacterium GW2011_GWC1_37_8]|uniref:Quinoprotein glucose dehydrogenase n=1 Tax=Candidatus Woesebacteria bacterium GW2011_GWB1_38_8 TaxID=1618570 RepID=A0A0G0KZ09_9BACT|nr:MAG: Quinoprotein glucose dehydrogenase [Microgenomates group bacterium GW2011_GWC1_37_8]KKQ84913.1 MAG: Quinoprotein glucose dehydrogenase [Candidatus Woesebacteria bacterium GW2011_GWB1_38_8]
MLVVLVLLFYRGKVKETQSPKTEDKATQVPLQSITGSEPSETAEDIAKVSVVAEGLEVPWALAFLPEGGMLVTERAGRVRFVSKDGELRQQPVVTISAVRQTGEGGLQGIALHPDFQNNNFVYLYYTYAGVGDNTLNRVVRYSYDRDVLRDEKIIVDKIAGAPNHDGGRIKFGPDKLLYITTGDAQVPSSAQDKNALAGKILRVNDDGTAASGNPFGNRVYSYGHRNPQGIAWDNDENLWETEHGPSGLETGNDEFNRIEIGRNYGWPEIRGSQTKSGMEIPITESGRTDTWAPAGLAYLGGKFYFAGLRGQALYQITVSGTSANMKTYFKGEFGRLREVVAGPDGFLYVSTSNRDGRGSSKSGDDKIIRINAAKL